MLGPLESCLSTMRSLVTSITCRGLSKDNTYESHCRIFNQCNRNTVYMYKNCYVMKTDLFYGTNAVCRGVNMRYLVSYL